MGQCHPLPDNEQLKGEMRLHARNHARIFDMYNFDYDPSPDSDLVKAWNLYAKKVVCITSSHPPCPMEVHTMRCTLSSQTACQIFRIQKVLS